MHFPSVFQSVHMPFIFLTFQSYPKFLNINKLISLLHSTSLTFAFDSNHFRSNVLPIWRLQTVLVSIHGLRLALEFSIFEPYKPSFVYAPHKGLTKHSISKIVLFEIMHNLNLFTGEKKLTNSARNCTHT